MAIILIIDFVKNLLMFSILMTNSAASLKIKKFFNGFWCCTFTNIEVAWLVYGNTFAYGHVAMTCKDMSDDINMLWVIMVTCLAFGYILFARYIMLFFGMIYIMLRLCLGVDYEKLREDRIVKKLPYLQWINEDNYKERMEMEI